MDVLSFVIVGHVDHGKSSLIGRLLHDTGAVPPDKIAEMKAASSDMGQKTEFAFLLDHLEEERKQGITIDTTQVFFDTDKRRYVIIDAPGHVEFVKNMITGASQAEAAVLIVDAEEGVREQTQRHSYMLSLLGVKQVIAVINKMDLVEYSEQRFNAVKDELGSFLRSVNIEPEMYIPISAIEGDNISKPSEKMGWYDGVSFLDSLDSLKNKPSAENKSLVLPIQDVYKVGDKRISAGRVEAGTIKAGMDIKILPSGETTQVKTIEKFLASPDVAVASESVGITTVDPVFLDRGNVVCVTEDGPTLTDRITASIFWMSKQPFSDGMKLTFRCATQETGCKIESINRRINSSSLETINDENNKIENLEVAQIEIKTKKPVAIKDFNDVQELGRFVLVHDGNTCAGGIINL